MDLSQINVILHNPSWDLLVIFAFIAIGFFYGILSGKARLIALLFSLYVSGFLFENFYYLDTLIKTQSAIEEFFFRIFAFAVIVGVLFVLFSSVLDLESGSEDRSWWQTLLLSFMSAGLLFSYVFHIFPGRELFTFSPVIQNLFVSETAFFWWLTLPLVSLFLARK